jgi:hypothetical protein
MDTILTTLEYKYELIKNAIRTGNFNEVINEIKVHIYTNKNIYIVLTFLVLLYTLYEQDYNRIISISKRQLGGETEVVPDKNTAPKPAESNSTPKKSGNSTGNDSSKGKKLEGNNNTANTASSGGKASQLAQGASGLCDGEGSIAKMCRGGKDGVTNYFKFFGYLILAGLAVLSPFVIYIVLVYMMLKIMFTGLKNI